MARYRDGSEDRRPDRYDEGFRRQGGGQGWGGGAMRGYDAGYGMGFGPEPRGGRFAPPEQEGPGGGIYGPARYGLGPYYRRLQERSRPDEELQEEVEEALFYDTWVDAEAITVEVAGGVVTLRGELPDYDEVRYAIDDAWDVDGVRGVRSELEIREQGR